MTQSKTVRAKFRCVSDVKQGSNNSARFVPVTDSTPENREFWAATPTGSLELTNTRGLNFQEGQEYYIDIIPTQVVNQKPNQYSNS